MSNIATTIKQSKHLLELGLDPDSADMFWMDTNSVKPCLNLIDDGIFNHRNYLVRFPNTSLPAWSLSALLAVMRKLNATITLQIIGNFTFLRIKDNGFIWQKDIHVKNPMDAVYGGMLWLFEQGLIKKWDNDE